MSTAAAAVLLWISAALSDRPAPGVPAAPELPEVSCQSTD
jgi:hypothetical protein